MDREKELRDSISGTDAVWLFSRRTDLLAFGGSAALALGILAVAAALGVAEDAAPEWMWIGCILAVDVAHVWSTLFRVYFDGEEVRRRPLLYLGTPALLYVTGLLLHAYSSRLFWTVLAYFAVYHFIRQQYGWVALYGRRARAATIDRWIDASAIYAATVYPILWWHAHLPRHFVWFTPDDFIVGLSPIVATFAAPLYWGAIGLFVARQIQRTLMGDALQTGKILVVLSTWLCWWLGIIVFDGDLAFTATNVLIHGIPYLVLTYRYGRARVAQRSSGMLATILRWGPTGFLLTVLAFAFLEEAFWDRWVWQERPWLFGGDGIEIAASMLTILVPLLAVPQATHYALDGFVWRQRSNPSLARLFS